MATPATIPEFLDLVKKSAVLEDRRLDPYLEKLRSGGALPVEPGKLAGLMVHDGLLTHFQAEQLLLGRWRRFSLGKYKVLERLGSGGMGVVYLCEHKMMRRRVAVKVLPTAKAKDRALLERFHREARAAAALDHPNIVHAYDIDQDEELHFLVMEWVDGASLEEIVKKTGPMDVTRACHYIRQTALGLGHAHAKGIVHRDVKPGNILVDRTGTVKILDMGLARFFNDEDDVLTKKYDENVLGTGDYMSPEQIEDSHSVDTRADIYSLGATFYFLLTGQAPFGEGTVHQKLTWHLTRQPKPVTALRAGVPEAVANLILRMLAKKPADRFGDLGAVVEALAPWTQVAIGPPPDSEMPAMSLAATGAAGDTSSTLISKGAPAVRSIPPSSRPATPFPVRPPVAPVVAPPPTPFADLNPVQGGFQPAQDAPAWHSLAADTDDLRGAADTSLSRLPRPPRQRRRLFLVLTLGGLVFVAATTFLIWQIVRSKTEPTPVARGPLEVGQAKTYRTIAEALAHAQEGDVIELCDAAHVENLMVTPTKARPTGVTLQAKPGITVVWSPASKDPTTPLLYLAKAENFRLHGKNLTLDGTIDAATNLRVEKLLFLTLHSPGVTLQDAHLQGFEKWGVYIMNCQGLDKRPVRLARLHIRGDKAEAKGIFFDADNQVIPPVNDHIHIEECQFPGLDVPQAITRKNSSVTGKNIRAGKWQD